MDVGDIAQAIMHEARNEIAKLKVEFAADDEAPEKGMLSVLAHSPTNSYAIAALYCDDIISYIKEALATCMIPALTGDFSATTEQVQNR